MTILDFSKSVEIVVNGIDNARHAGIAATPNLTMMNMMRWDVDPRERGADIQDLLTPY